RGIASLRDLWRDGSDGSKSRISGGAQRRRILSTASEPGESDHLAARVAGSPGSARISRDGDDVSSSWTFRVVAAPNAFGVATTRKTRVHLDQSAPLCGNYTNGRQECPPHSRTRLALSPPFLPDRFRTMAVAHCR